MHRDSTHWSLAANFSLLINSELLLTNLSGLPAMSPQEHAIKGPIFALLAAVALISCVTAGKEGKDGQGALFFVQGAAGVASFMAAFSWLQSVDDGNLVEYMRALIWPCILAIVGVVALLIGAQLFGKRRPSNKDGA